MNDNQGREFSRRTWVFVFVFLAGIVSSFSAPDLVNVGERYQLKGNAVVRLSAETGWKRQGLTPVQFEIQGLNLRLWMDGENRVFDGVKSASRGAEKTMLQAEALFRLDPIYGQIQTAAQTLTGEVYEQNALRTRLRFSDLKAALDLDIQGGRASLDLNGLLIPLRLHLGPSAGGVQELGIGELGNRGEGRLFLDAGQGQLFWEDIHAGRAKEKTGRVVWAEKQK